MSERGMGRVYRPTRDCLHCAGSGCDHCKGTGKRQIETWTIQFSFRGRQHRESSGSTRRADGVRILKQRMAEVGAGKRCAGPPTERATFEKLVEILRDDYRLNRRKSARRLETSIDRLKEHFAGSRAIDITADRIRLYMRHRLDEGREPSTVRNELNALRRAFRLAHEAGLVAEIPHFPKLDVNNVRQGFFEPDEIMRVIDNLPTLLKPIVEFGYLTGWRLGEVLPLSWTQVDFTEGVIRLEVGTTKNSEGRVLPFHVLPALKMLMERQRAYTSRVELKRSMVISRVFHRSGKEIKSFARAWKKACLAAGCPGRIFHDLRRTAVRGLERAGVPRSIAMKITGHKTEAVYRRYAIVNEADMAEGFQRLAGYLEGRTAR